MCELQLWIINDFIFDFVYFGFEYWTSKAADKFWNINQRQYSYIWQYQKFTDFQMKWLENFFPK